jgi:hypothetical protein
MVKCPLNHAMLEHPAAIYLTDYFYRLCIIAVPAILAWLYVSWPARSRYPRTVLVVLTLLDLPLVWLFPESPPQFAQTGTTEDPSAQPIKPPCPVNRAPRVALCPPR